MLKLILASVDTGKSLEALLATFTCDESTEEFVIDLGGPTLMDVWAPRIAKMRADGIKWTEIVEITGMDLNRVYRAWKRFVDAQHTFDDIDEQMPSSDDNKPDDSTVTDEVA